MERRRCKICGAYLSRYNPEDICYAHQEGIIPYEFLPVTRCTSYSPLDNPKDGKWYGPGKLGYNDMAFNRIPSGKEVQDGPKED